jgi:dolichol-phosphate mannosyltransferase
VYHTDVPGTPAHTGCNVANMASELHPALSLVVPTYNERDRLHELVDSILSVFDAHRISGEIVVVDDNSPDGTGQLADDLAATRPMQVVHRAGKLGLGTAVMEGFARARSGILGVIDADLSHPPALLPAMLTLVEREGLDIVIGSRYIPGGGAADWSAARLAMSKFACVFARGLTPVRDATSGFFLVRRSVIENVQIAAGGFKICLELLVRSPITSVGEVPYVFVGRTAGESKMNRKEALGYLSQLWLLYRVRYGQRRPRPRYHQVSLQEAAELAASRRATGSSPTSR